MKEIQRDPSDEAAVPAQMPEVFTCESACIYNHYRYHIFSHMMCDRNGKCVSVLTIERLQTFLEAYEATKKAGMHTTIQPPVQDTATESIGGLYFTRQKAQEEQLSAKSKKAQNSMHWSHLPTFDQPCVNGAWSPRKSSLTLVRLRK
eukprot:3191-Pelagomonas_calceolata.AAC.1